MERSLQQIIDQQAIVLFDGYCNLCSGSVQFIIERDEKGYFYFTSLQSDEAKKVSEHQGVDLEKFDSIVLIEKGTVYYQSTAALRVARKLGGLWPIFYVFIIIPQFLRDPIYAWIARNRYKWFGKKDQCMIPTPELKSRFL